MPVLWIIAADKKEVPGIDVVLDEKKSDSLKIEFHTCGIGLWESFFNFTNLVNNNGRPDAIWLLGTAGSPRAEDIFKIGVSHHFLNTRFTDEELPDFLPATWETGKSPLFKKPEGALAISLYSTFGISLSTRHFEKNMAGAWENMEALSLSYVCYKNEIPFMAMVCCTNQICSEGRMQWKRNFLVAGEKLVQALKKLLPKL